MKRRVVMRSGAKPIAPRGPWWALVLYLVWQAPARAQEEGAAAVVQPPAVQVPADTPETQAPSVDELLESTRRSLRSTAEWLARAVDGRFGDKSFDDGGKVSNGRADLTLHKRQGESRELDLRFNASFRLPNLERHVQVFFGNDDERDMVTDSPQAFSQQQRLLETRPAERSFFAGVKMPLLELFEFRLGVHGPLKPFAQASFDRSWKLTDEDVVEFRETVFWTVADHLGSTTVGSYAHAFTPTLFGRWLNSATITRVSNRFEWNSSIGAYRAFGEQRVLSLEALLSGFQGSGVDVSDYGLQVRWEQPVYSTWLLGEVGVGHFWPRKDPASERGRAWALGVALKLKF